MVVEMVAAKMLAKTLAASPPASRGIEQGSGALAIRQDCRHLQ